MTGDAQGQISRCLPYKTSAELLRTLLRLCTCAGEIPVFRIVLTAGDSDWAFPEALQRTARIHCFCIFTLFISILYNSLNIYGNGLFIISYHLRHLYVGLRYLSSVGFITFFRLLSVIILSNFV